MEIQRILFWFKCQNKDLDVFCMPNQKWLKVLGLVRLLDNLGYLKQTSLLTRLRLTL